MDIDFWFEFGSTYSYPAAMRVEELAGQAGVGVNWRPFLLGAIFREQGLSDSPFNLYPAKGRYMWHDLERTCRALGIPFKSLGSILVIFLSAGSSFYISCTINLINSD